MPDAQEQFIFRYLEEFLVTDTQLLVKQKQLLHVLVQIQSMQILLSRRVTSLVSISLDMQSFHLMVMNALVKDHTMFKNHPM